MKEELRIVGRAEDYKGANTHYKLTDGRVVTREEAVQMHKDGQLQDYHIYPRHDVEYLRDNPDPSIEDNIDEQELLNP
jgi:hypothetical protein